jgi:hypothetical protein
VLSELQRASV